MVEYAYAKVNRYLRLTGKRTDGYHTLRSVMQTISLRDELRYEPSDSPFSFRCSDPDLNHAGNLCVRAANAFARTAGKPLTGELVLTKRIPAGAGLGGGSADAAAVLRLLQNRNGYPLSERELLSLAESLGADVPFCVHGGKALCEGIGERMTPLPDGKTEYLLVIKPNGSLSTADMYRAWDAAHPDGSVCAPVPENGNDFEPLADALLPVIGELRETLLRLGASEAMMSGSGSAVFGVFGSASACRDAERRWKQTEGSDAFFAAGCRTVPRY